MSNEGAFFAILKNPIKFRVFLLMHLPSAFFSGVRVVSADNNSCSVTVPYKWFSKNPFKSTYFACLAMAGEMSTGVLCMAHIHQRKPGVSMLVSSLQANYYKKARSLTTFTCTDGEAIRETIEKAIADGESKSLITRSAGKNEAGELVAEFLITWSFKSK